MSTSLSRCFPSRLMKPDAVRPAALKRSWYTTVSGRKELSAAGASSAQMVVYSAVSPSRAMTAPPACRPMRPVSSVTSESPRRKLHRSASGSGAPPVSSASDTAAAAAQGRLRRRVTQPFFERAASFGTIKWG